jgi:hypothetical protein
LGGWVNGIFQDKESFLTFYGLRVSLVQAILARFYAYDFIRPTLLVLAIFGLFYKNSYGWILLSIWFYFVLFEITFISIPLQSWEWPDYFLLVIPISFVGIMNLKQMRTIYKIDNKLLALENMASVIVALSLVYIVGYIHLNYDVSIFRKVEFLRMMQ